MLDSALDRSWTQSTIWRVDSFTNRSAIVRRDQFTPGSSGRLTTITVIESDRISGGSTSVASLAFVPGPLPETVEFDDSPQRLLEEYPRLFERPVRLPDLLSSILIAS